MGQLRCQLFFVVSGFTIANSWYSKEQKASAFYIRRWKSIAPGYYIMILIYWMFDCARKLIGHDQHIQFWKGAIVNALFLNGFFPQYNNNIVPGGWFIGTTAFFYFVFPVLVKTLSKINQKIACLVPLSISIVCFIIGNIYPSLGKNGSFLYYSFIVQAPAIILGILLYFDYTKKNVLGRHEAVRWMAGFAVASIVIFYGNFNGAFMLISLCSGFLFYMLFTISLHSKECRWLVTLGKKSYGMFLTHMFFAHQLSAVLSKAGMKMGVHQTACFAIAYLIAIIGSYYAAGILNMAIKELCRLINLN